MKKRFTFILLLLMLLSTLSFTQIYVSPTGSDSSDGSIDHPYRTIQKAMSVVSAGDLIYLRDGIYNISTTIQTGISGLSGQHIKLWAYPGETPILDFALQSYSSSSRGLYVSRDYWHIQGLTIRYAGDNGIYITGDYNIVVNCTLYKNKDTGLQISGGGGYNVVVNCDSYDNYDSLTHGENADGFAPKLDIGPGNEFHGCRAWNNSDDGWDLYEGQNGVLIDSCWAFHNGYNIWGDLSFQGDGNGIKVGGNYIPAAHRVTHSIAFDNKSKGFDQNHNTAGVTLYNNTAWRNGGNNFAFAETPGVGQDTLINNISGSGNISINTGAVQTTNSWQGFTVAADDFLSTDTSLAHAPRNSDGTLSTNDFLRLATGSDLINSGTDVGFPYNGIGPDLGALESGTNPLSYTITASAGIHGQITPSGMITVPQGNDTTFNFTPDTGYHVDSVIVDDVYIGQVSLYTFSDVQGNHAIRVTFSINTYTLTISAENGIILKDPEDTIFEHGTNVQLTAIPDVGFSFIGWSGDAGGSENPITVTMDADKNITAHFGQDSVIFTVYEGWNMVSLPSVSEDPRKINLFPTSESAAFTFEGTYVQRDTIECAIGYWLRFSQEENIKVWGTPNLNDTVNVSVGWNMIGALSIPIFVLNITSDPPGMVTSGFLTYTGSYVSSDTMYPGKGYWVKAPQTGKLILSGGGKILAQNRIRTEMPADTPPPPPGSDETMVGNSVSSYYLDQNYPNPFNPTTKISFVIGLPAEVSQYTPGTQAGHLPARQLSGGSFVTLKVFDMLGREVATLMNELKQPGEYTVHWNAEGVQSGMYFYRLSVGNFTQTRKLIILK